MSREVWRAYGPEDELVGERRVTRNTEAGYSAVLYDPKELAYAERKGRELCLTTDIRREVVP